jgi:hypothetical protein
MAGAMQSK